MSLSAEEYREHLATTAIRAGFDFSDVVLPGEGDIRIGELQMHYLDWGSKGKKPILFLHGGALTAHTWDLCCLALRDDFHCIALDQRGHGDTDWAPDGDYSIAAQVADVRGFIDHTGLQDFVLVGMSMGAINALSYAINHSDRLSHLVIIDAGPEMRRPDRAASATSSTMSRTPCRSRRSSSGHCNSTRAATRKSCAAA